jgi:hypothetical protein
MKRGDKTATTFSFRAVELTRAFIASMKAAVLHPGLGPAMRLSGLRVRRDSLDRRRTRYDEPRVPKKT